MRSFLFIPYICCNFSPSGDPKNLKRMEEQKEKLFAEFPPVGTQEWLDKIQVDLKGADFEKRLVWKTTEGFKVQPFYRREDTAQLPTTNALPGEYPYLRGTKTRGNGWSVRQAIRVADVAEAREKALDILNKGVDSLAFHLKKDLVSREAVEQLLEGIRLEAVEVYFDTCPRHTAELARILRAYFEAKGYRPEQIRGGMGFDPVGKMLKKGVDAPDFGPIGKELAETFADYPHFRPITVHPALLCHSGAYIYQELGYALSWGNEYLRQLTEAGVPAGLAASKIGFSMGIGSNYFMELAKFRALRMLWAHVAHAYRPEAGEHEEEKAYIHAETSHFNLTLYDAYVNLLRTQTEAMSAALGGVDALTVTPFDYAYEEPNDFSERLARNQQLLLKEESHLDKVADPAAGSYYIENLTVSLAREGWKLFLDTEEKGGFLAEVKSGAVQDAVNATHRARLEAIAKRRESLLGTNQFPNFTEQAGGKTPRSCKCSCGCGGETAYKTLDGGRGAEEFEALRLATEQGGKVPTAFMLTIGNLAMRQARAQFSCNFLACAGYKVIDNLGFDSVEAGVEAALKAGADIVVLCSSDEEYADYAVPAYKALGGKALFIVAGNPPCAEELKAAGIRHFIHVRVNVLETLKELNEELKK